MNKKLQSLLCALIVSMSLFAQPQFKKDNDPKPSDKKWVKVDVLSDEFRSFKPNESKWQLDPVGNDFAWIGRPPALFRAENVKNRWGKMCVTVSKLPKDTLIKENLYTHQGAIVRSWAPGKPGMYFEAKMRANATVMSSTFWLMSKYDCKKKLETDIQECVGRTTEESESWSKGWDSIFHSNAIHRQTKCNDKLQLQNATQLDEPNYKDYHVYAMWWKSPEELLFYLDGEYQYTIKPKVEWDMPAYIHMAIETYSWNPIPEDGGLVEHGTKKQRTTKYDWVRVWQLEDL